MRITLRQLRGLIRESLASEGLFEAKRSRHPKMRPGPLPDPSETFTPQFVTLPAGFRMFHGSPHGGKITLPTGPSWFAPERETERAAETAAEELATTNKDIVFGHFFPDTWDKPDYSDPNVRSIIQNWQDHVSQEEIEGISGVFSPPLGHQIKRGELRDIILQEIENTFEGKRASKSKGKPYKGSRRGKTESQAQQMAAGIALSAREKYGKKGAIKKLRGASKSMAAMSMKDLRKLATIRRGSEVPDSTKKGKERAALPGHIRKKK